MQELPSITTSNYCSTTLSGNDGLSGVHYAEKFFTEGRVRGELVRHNGPTLRANQMNVGAVNTQQATVDNAFEVNMSIRIVKVIIADPNENLPLEKRVLFNGPEKLTDLTDQELFFDVQISDLLGKHNDYRKTVVDKKASEKFGRDIFLEPVRIRDLKMVVVTVASF